MICSDSLCGMLTLAGRDSGYRDRQGGVDPGEEVDHGLSREIPGPHGKGKVLAFWIPDGTRELE